MWETLDALEASTMFTVDTCPCCRVNVWLFVLPS